jgi:hypothetical protein
MHHPADSQQFPADFHAVRYQPECVSEDDGRPSLTRSDYYNSPKKRLEPLRFSSLRLFLVVVRAKTAKLLSRSSQVNYFFFFGAAFLPAAFFGAAFLAFFLAIVRPPQKKSAGGWY